MQAALSLWRRTRGPLVALALLAAALVAYYRQLLFGGSLDALDWQQHVHFYQWIHMSLRDHGMLPLYLPRQYQTWSHSLAWLPESPILQPLIWLLYVLPAQAYLKSMFVLCAAVGALGAYRLARALAAPPLSATLAAALFTLQGFPVAHFIVGHHSFLGLYLWPFAVLLFLRAIDRGGQLPSTVGLAGVISLLILSGYQHPAVWLVALLGAWALLAGLRERSFTPVRVFAQALALVMGLSAARLLPAALGFAGFDPPERFTGIPAAELARTLTVGGPQFAAGSGFTGRLVPFSWEHDASVGVLGAVLLVAGLVWGRRSSEAILLIVAGLALALSVDLGFAPWVLMGQRVPSRFLFVVVFCTWVVAVRGLASAEAGMAARGARWWPKLRRPLLLACLGLLVAERYVETRPWLAFGAGNPVVTRTWSPGLPRVEAGQATATVVEVTPNRVAWDIHAAAPSQLLLPLTTSRRWLEWRTDGYSASIRGRNPLVEVPTGTHRIEAKFTPVGFRTGIAITLVSLLASLSLLLPRHRRAKARMPTAAP